MSASPKALADQVPEEITPTTWQRLSARIILVDLAISVLSVMPALVAIWVFGVDASDGQIWPLIGLAAFGVLGAFFDVIRWIFTRFRISAHYVELKTGVFLRRHRSIQRDRIRSVDVEAKLRHRLARMRVVKIGAGQQTAAGEAALSLDALTADDASTLQNRLLRDAHELPESRPGTVTSQDTHPHPEASKVDERIRVFARFEPSWFIYNMFTIWA